MAEVKEALEPSHRLRPGRPDNFRIQSFQQLIDQARLEQERLDTIMRGIARATLRTGAFRLMNMLLMAISHRTLEPEVRVAVGGRRVDLLSAIPG